MNLTAQFASVFPQPGDVVLHYKGGLYIVLFLAVDEASEQDVVVYTACKPPAKNAKQRTWVRTLKNWQQRVDVSGKPRRNGRPRFMEVKAT